MYKVSLVCRTGWAEVAKTENKSTDMKKYLCINGIEIQLKTKLLKVFEIQKKLPIFASQNQTF
jgi:hypothetical protein